MRGLYHRPHAKNSATTCPTPASPSAQAHGQLLSLEYANIESIRKSHESLFSICVICIMLLRRHSCEEARISVGRFSCSRIGSDGARELQAQDKRGTMRSAQQWLAAYAAHHCNPINRRIHTVCVPAILFSILGISWHVQIQGAADLWWANGATILSLLALVFYWRLGLSPFLTMAATFAVMIAIVMGLEWGTSLPTLPLYCTIFVLAWIAQFVGHKLEGKAPSFFDDLQFLLIGPLWVIYH